MAQLSDFVSALKEGGARPNQFDVTISGSPVSLPNEFRFLCKGASIPALTMGEIAVPYRGRQIYVTGDRTYDVWTITVISDRDMIMRSAFEKWQDHLQDIGVLTNRTAIGEQPTKYYADAVVRQLDRNDHTLRSYKLYDIWPTSVDAIEFNHETNDSIVEFTVNFRFNFMTIEGSPSGKIGWSGSG